MNELIREPTDEALNKVLTLLKWVEGSKIYSSDANKITGCTVPVIVKAFEDLGKPVKLKKMIKNGECYRAILNVEPINAQDRNVVIRKDPKWRPMVNTLKDPLPITDPILSDYGDDELMIFKIISSCRWTNNKNEKYDDGRLVGGWWYVIEDIWGRRFVNVHKDLWKPAKVNISNPKVNDMYYGRVRISDNKTKYEPDSRYINFYEIEEYDSDAASDIANAWSSELHGIHI